MSTPNKSGSSEFEIDLDLHFLPAWAQRPPAENKYSRYEGGEEGRGPRGDRSAGRDQRHDRPPRRDQNREGPTRMRGPEGATGPRREGGRSSQRFERREERREPPAPPIQLNIALVPEEKGVEALARQIRLTGRAYPLFDIAHLILKKPDRYDVHLSVIKGPDGQPLQPLFVCGLDDTLWFSEQDAVNYVLDKHFSTFYQSEKIPTDPPKGVYTFVAQCGISGIILGPPNYHDYQNKLRKLHNERFSRMPFDVFKSRVKIVKDEAVVKKWIEEQSFRTEYICLNVPEAIKLATREEVEKHFRETHFPNVIKTVESYTLSGTAAQQQPNRAIYALVRRTWDEQNRFPIKVVNTLSQQFAGHALQFFKVNKNVTHVAVARPRYLDLEETPASENVRRVIEFIRNTPKCTRRKIFEALAPASPAKASAEADPAAVEPPAPPEGHPSRPAAEVAPSPEIAAVNSDLHWLIHQGHVIEFANGILEAARKPPPRPPRPEPKRAEPKSAQPGTEQALLAQATEGEVEGLGQPGVESEPAAPEPITPASTPTEPSEPPAAELGTVGAESPPAPDPAHLSLGSASTSGSGAMTAIPDPAVHDATPASGTIAESEVPGEKTSEPEKTPAPA